MRIVHLFWSLGFGGIETMLVNIANAQAAKGADVYVFIINRLYEDTLISALHPQVHLVLFNRKLGSHNPWFIFKLNQKLRQINPKIIHIHRSELFNFIISRRLSREVALTLHALPKGSVRREPFYKRLLNKKHRMYTNVESINKIPHIYAISQAVKDELLHLYGINSVVVNNGIIVSKFKQRPAIPVHNTLKIVQVSRLEHDKKGQDLLIHAIAKLNGKASVEFIGDGSSMEYLKNMAKELHVEHSVRFLGKKDPNYVATHLCEYDLFVQPSRWEGFGLTVAEAMAARLPVLVSKGQGPAEVTCNERYGWLFENGNVDDLTMQIEYIYVHYDEVIQKAMKALNYVKETYDVSITAHKYLEQYRKNHIHK